MLYFHCTFGAGMAKFGSCANKSQTNQPTIHTIRREFCVLDWLRVHQKNRVRIWILIWISSFIDSSIGTTDTKENLNLSSGSILPDFHMLPIRRVLSLASPGGRKREYAFGYLPG
ncbi:hypothetical protein AVEN_202406-1 [Araneus ventricosus]|uniref:Uncharacterized protein n=1 Tax=Araneus ventricosus TaxID=182803 RepID=A0A4Y2QR87_ARAVE|nr:hypothetical protein AVEN_202406-1 [Araneus ventricosus]